ncbi:MAG: hypothetical protein E6H94_08185 [Chloroflexi bacterium]|nr:MAG: hypothetical protein E6H94_08185 [Chloroflexota bacterium]
MRRPAWPSPAAGARRRQEVPPRSHRVRAPHPAPPRTRRPSSSRITFHRVEDWVVQGGDPLGNGTGGGKVPSEYNDLPFVLGAVGIARGQDPAINNDSQWFVVKKDSSFLNNQYTNFGLVTAGMDVIMGIKIGDRIKSIKIE